MEEFALQYVNQSDSVLRVESYGLIVVGGLLAWIFHRSEAQMTRAPYFAWLALLFLASVASQFVWLFSIPAFSGGYLWVFMLTDLISAVTIGFGYGVIAKARSRDAFGDASKAFLGFIPIANLWLIFSRSQSLFVGKRLSSAFVVLVGFILFFIGSTLMTALQKNLERMATAAQDDPSIQKVGLDLMLRTSDLSFVLAEMATGVTTPTQVD